MPLNNAAVFGLAAGIIWYALCTALSRASRRSFVPDRNTFPTSRSELFRWMAIIGFIVLCGAGLVVEIRQELQ
jgi:hypothetical protein